MSASFSRYFRLDFSMDRLFVAAGQQLGSPGRARQPEYPSYLARFQRIKAECPSFLVCDLEGTPITFMGLTDRAKVYKASCG